MRALRVLLALAAAGACSGSGSDASGGRDQAEACGEARACTAEDDGCATFPYESLPPRCGDICYRGRCCAEIDGEWSLVVHDCTRPVEAGDAGVDAP